jgi:D-glucosaminate-6-phosphate ammonia-lyase
VRAAYLQNIGIGRGMKIGKESMAGAIRAMELWMTRDHAAARAAERAALEMWMGQLGGLPGIHPRIVPDPTGNPLDRLQVDVDPGVAGATAAAIARHLGGLDPAIIVRNHEVELGYFQLDPCNLAPGQAEIVGRTLRETLLSARSLPQSAHDADEARNGGVTAYLNWLA